MTGPRIAHQLAIKLPERPSMIIQALYRMLPARKIDICDFFMSGFGLLIRHIGGSRKSGLKKWSQGDLALKSN
jgi:hypothetical protein